MDIIHVAIQCCRDVVKNLGVNILHEERVKRAEFIKRIKFVNQASRVCANDHRELLDVVDIDLFPELRGGFWKVINALEDLHKRG